MGGFVLSPSSSLGLATTELRLPPGGASPLARARLRMVPRSQSRPSRRDGRRATRQPRAMHRRVRMTDLGPTDPSDSRPIGHPGLQAMAEAVASGRRNSCAARKPASALCTFLARAALWRCWSCRRSHVSHVHPSPAAHSFRTPPSILRKRKRHSASQRLARQLVTGFATHEHATPGSVCVRVRVACACSGCGRTLLPCRVFPCRPTADTFRTRLGCAVPDLQGTTARSRQWRFRLLLPRQARRPACNPRHRPQAAPLAVSRGARLT